MPEIRSNMVNRTNNIKFKISPSLTVMCLYCLSQLFIFCYDYVCFVLLLSKFNCLYCLHPIITQATAGLHKSTGPNLLQMFREFT
jgi:hypothetical protein